MFVCVQYLLSCSRDHFFSIGAYANISASLFKFAYWGSGGIVMEKSL